MHSAEPTAYAAYGRVFESPIPLSGFASADLAQASVSIRFGPVPMTLSSSSAGRHSWQANNDEVLVVDRKVSRIHVSRRGIITIDPTSDVGRTDERLHGIPIAAAVGFNGSVVLHGAAADVDGAAVLLVGGNGAGKSTTAAALGGLTGGAVCDNLAVVDIAAADGTVQLQRGPSSIRLWSDSAALLDVDVANAPRVNAVLDKFVVNITRSDDRPLPISAIVAIGPVDADTPALTRLDGAAAIETVRQNQFRRRMAETILQNGDELLSTIAAAVPTFSLRRPQAGWPPDKLAEWLRISLSDA